MEKWIGIGSSAAMVVYTMANQRRRGPQGDIKMISAAYYIGMLVVFVREAMATSGKRRGFAIFLAVGAVAMTGWSFMLSSAITFDEVFPAWLAYATLAIVYFATKKTAQPS